MYEYQSQYIGSHLDYLVLLFSLNFEI